MIPPAGGPAGSSQASQVAIGGATYEIRVAGHLDDHWAITLGDVTLFRHDDGTTSLTGPLIDQAQLHGLITRIRDLGVPLLGLHTRAGPGSMTTKEGAEDEATRKDRVRGTGSAGR